MKKVNSLLAITTIFGLMLVASCAPEEEEDTTPTDPRDKYVGTWSCAEKSQLYSDYSYQANIKKSTTNTSQVLIENFYNLGFNTNVVASVSSTTLNISQQTVSGQAISGNGTSSGNNTINFSYIANDGGNAVDTVTVAFTK